MRTPVLFAMLMASVVGAAAEAQQPARTTVDNQHAWLTYVGDHALSTGSKTSVHLESQVRRGDLGADWQQLLLRAGVTRTMSQGVRATGELASSVRIEAGYLHHYLLKSSGRDAERNHTVQVSILSAAPLPF